MRLGRSFWAFVAAIAAGFLTLTALSGDPTRAVAPVVMAIDVFFLVLGILKTMMPQRADDED